MIAAALLCEEKIVLKGCPFISDVCDMVEILQNLGAEVWWEDSDLCLECRKIEKDTVEVALAEKMRFLRLAAGETSFSSGGRRLVSGAFCVPFAW